MKGFRIFISVLLMLVLTALTCLCVVSVALKACLLNSGFYVKHSVSDKYVDSMLAEVRDNLDYVGVLYGFSDGELDPLFTETDVRYCAQTAIDALFAASESGQTPSLQLDSTRFYDYMVSNGGDAEAAEHFAEDAVDAVESCVFAITDPLASGTITNALSNKYAKGCARLIWLLIPLVLAAAVLLLFVPKKLQVGLIFMSGGIFLGSAIPALTLLQIIISNYAGRLALGGSAMGIQLSALLKAALNGSALVCCGVCALSLVVLVTACLARAKKKKA